MVASKFVDLVKNEYEITVSDEKTLDITDNNALEKYFDENVFDVVINFAAFTNVDGAEAQRDDETGLVWKLNVEAPKNLAIICKNKNIFLIHISTDFVFRGNEEDPGPYTEDSAIPDSPEGLGWYAWTKNRAEKEIEKSEVRYAIVRYGYPFRASEYELKKDWARNLLGLYNEQKLYPLFDDQIQSVIFIDDLTVPLSKIINNEISGIFHIVSKDTTTPYEIGSYLLGKYAGKSVEIQKGSMVEFLKSPGRTPRPRLGGLKVEKTEQILNLEMPTWKQMVDKFIDQIKKEN